VVPGVASPPRPLPRAAPPGAALTASRPPSADINPYAAPVRPTLSPLPPRPAAPLQESSLDAPLAGRGTRLLAQLLDGLLGLLCMLPGIVLMLVGIALTEPGEGVSILLPVALGLVGIGILGLLVYQLRLLGREGQTWGKKQMKIRIVLYDTGEIPGLGRSLGLRIVVNNLIGNVPFLGALYALADPLFIFGEERRCLHDLLAGTKVVEAG
jgi:uncharacterized RDD family membrane protein YckC